MKALKATVTILLDPRVIGPDAQTEWGGPDSDASASDWMSAVLSEVNMDIVLDWGYEYPPMGNVVETAWNEVEVDPDTYEEGDMFADGD